MCVLCACVTQLTHMRVLQYFNSFSHSLTCNDIDSSLVRCSINFRHYEVITRTLEGADSAANFIVHHFTVIYKTIQLDIYIQ